MNGEDRAADALENPRLPGHLGECVEFRLTFVRRQIPVHQELAETEGEDIEEPLRGEAGGGEVAIAIGEMAGGVETFALGEPLEVAALAPVGEVDLGNGSAIEL